ncbi:DUF1419 domain-containing protein (plasmid) [Rhizobium sp. NIBRBAC000502774]|nr:DUF1419 domain-containing protein [Rhizobium sp. NIBRBAC000502774]
MPTTSLDSAFRRVYDGVASTTKALGLLGRHDAAPMSMRRLSGELHAGEWFELEEPCARTMAGPFHDILRSGDFAPVPGVRVEHVRSIVFSLLDTGSERWFHGFTSLVDPDITPQAMQTAIIERLTTEPAEFSRQEMLELIWNQAGNDGGYSDEIWPPGNEGFRTIIVRKPGFRPVLKLLAHLSLDEVKRLLNEP